MARIVIVSFRLGGTDGVAIESAKWTGALATLGHSVRTVAGEGIADVQIPGLAINATTSTSIQALETALADADLVIVEKDVYKRQRRAGARGCPGPCREG